MTDRPIIFSAPMVRALLAGRKTQTRRVIKPRGKRPSLFDGGWSDSYVLNPGNADWRAKDLPCAGGDRLYVRESWCHTGAGVWSIDDARMAIDGRPIYRATDEADAGTKWWPSIHMPREFSRMTLKVSEVRVQRLHDISEEDALAEGAAKLSWDGEGHWFEDEAGGTYRCGFAGIWQHLHGAESWDANPFVVAINFAVEHRNIDSQRSLAA